MYCSDMMKRMMTKPHASAHFEDVSVDVMRSIGVFELL